MAGMGVAQEHHVGTTLALLILNLVNSDENIWYSLTEGSLYTAVNKAVNNQ